MRGGDSSGLRAYNERLIVSVIRQAGSLSKAEIARRTGLSGQGASVIVNALLDEGLLIKLGKIRGQVGQPSTPIALNPHGAFSLGVKIGRRSIQVALVDMLGETIARRGQRYAAPYPDETLSAAAAFSRELLDGLGEDEKRRVVGLGMAIPGDLHEWAEQLGLPADALSGWREADPAATLSRATGLEVSAYNDATAACAAEMIAGRAVTRSSALYFYIGTFVGGGVVIGGRLYRGAQLNAGAVGSMPLDRTAPGAPPRQLIASASAAHLEHALDAAGLDARAALTGARSDAADAVFERWLAGAAPALARAAVAAISVIDFETIVIDGLLPPPWRERLADRVRAEMSGFDRTGLSPAEVAVGSIGPGARALGAALLPLYDRFSPDKDLLGRSAAPEDARAARP